MTSESPTLEVSTERPRDLDSLVNRLAGLVTHGGSILTGGDIASLRRMDPRHPASAFFKLAGAELGHDFPSNEGARELIETRWATILLGLTVLGDLHQSGARLGRALVDADFSELRFERVLRADADRLIDELPTLARFLAAKGTRVDWTDAARLILSAGRKDEETARRRLARDYFGALARKTSH